MRMGCTSIPPEGHAFRLDNLKKEPLHPCNTIEYTLGSWMDSTMPNQLATLTVGGHHDVSCAPAPKNLK